MWAIAFKISSARPYSRTLMYGLKEATKSQVKDSYYYMESDEKK